MRIYNFDYAIQKSVEWTMSSLINVNGMLGIDREFGMFTNF